jgi:hypothetical protein
MSLARRAPPACPERYTRSRVGDHNAGVVARLAWAGTLAAAGILALAGAGRAAAAWEPPERAANGAAPSRSADVAVNQSGAAAAVWVQGRGARRTVVVTLRAAGGAWERPQGISARGRAAIDPRVAIDAGGGIVVAWRQVVRTRVLRVGRERRRQAVYVARVRERAPDAEWGPVRTLSSDRQKVGPPALGLDAGGGAVVAWHWGTGTRPGLRGFVGRIQLAERSPAGRWTAARSVSGSSLCAQVRLPEVSVGPRGRAVVWWGCDTIDGGTAAFGVARDAGGAFGPELLLPFRTEGRLAADLAVAPDGAVVAVSADDEDALRWWRGRVSGSRVVLDDLPAPGGPALVHPRARRPRIVVEPSEDALSAWIDDDGQARAASIAAGLGVAAPTTLSPPGVDVASLRVAASADGRGVVAMVERSTGAVLAAERSAAGAWGAAQALTRTGGANPSDSPRVATDAAGGAVAYWTRRGTTGLFVARAQGRVAKG